MSARRAAKPALRPAIRPNIANRGGEQRAFSMDLICLGIVLVFFLASLVLVALCDRLLG